ncbi:ABC transporter permease [Buchananella hordeovulneris]|uniref:ABC transporter permease n=1 Tax=Buchananella hordeovulneris TaxID=52770 RepID=UPI000F5EAB63|nr:ABC transporter permease [Buchananella hordeovulneris]RRD53339.1 ABC transporter permease [Buchananella hordeovulneris]
MTASDTLQKPRVIQDTLTMIGRNLKHNLRMPVGLVMVIIIPLIFLLLFVYVLGGTLGAGLAANGTRADYLAYITPAILLMAAASATQMIAVWISTDMVEGIVARFRTMAIARSSVLAGHVYGGVILILFSTGVLLGLSLLLGYRPHAGAGHWLGLAAFLLLLAVALAWLTVALGLAAQGPETASNTTMLLMILPLLSNGFVPTSTMPGWLQGFAKHQPFTSIVDTIRNFLDGSPQTGPIIWAIGWCLVMTILGYSWSVSSFRRRASRR